MPVLRVDLRWDRDGDCTVALRIRRTVAGVDLLVIIVFGCNYLGRQDFHLRLQHLNATRRLTRYNRLL